MFFRRLVWLTVVAASLAAAGCFGSGPDPAPSGPGVGQADVDRPAPGAPPAGHDWTAADRRALAAPPNVETNVASLAEYLTSPFDNDYDKCRAVFTWTADRIAYDARALYGGSGGDASPDGVLASGRAVCEGFSGLVKALCDAAGVTAVVIEGMAKEDDYRPGKPAPFDRSHAWNAVRIDGRWLLMDATWGAGRVEGGRFIKNYSDFWFLTPPGAFAFSHLPDDQKWQLVAEPLTQNQFWNTQKLGADFFELGFSPQQAASAARRTGFRGFPTAYLLTDNRVRVRRAPLTGVLRHGQEYEFEVVAPEAEKMVLLAEPDYFFLVRRGDAWFVRVWPPRPGKLALAAKHPSADAYEVILEYDVE